MHPLAHRLYYPLPLYDCPTPVPPPTVPLSQIPLVRANDYTARRLRRTPPPAPVHDDGTRPTETFTETDRIQPQTARRCAKTNGWKIYFIQFSFFFYRRHIYSPLYSINQILSVHLYKKKKKKNSISGFMVFG